MGVGSIPVDENFHPVLALKDDVSGNVYPVHIGALVTGSDGKQYARMDVDVSVSASLAGNLTNNSAAPGAANVGALTGIANAAPPTYTEGDQVLASLDLSGNTRIKVMNVNANGQSTMANSAPVVIASDQSAVKTRGDVVAGAVVTTISASASATGSGTTAAADFVVQLDVSAYRWVSLQLSGTWSGTFTFQGSNDNANWVSCALNVANSTGGGTFSTTTNGVFYGPINFRYFRVRCTTYSSNSSLAGTCDFYYTPANITGNSTSAIQSGAWNVNSGSDITVFASGAQTTTQTQADQTNTTNARGILVVLDTTTAASGSVTLEIDGKDAASGKYYSLLTGAAVTSVTTNVYTVYPGNTVAANVSASTALPHTWRIKVTANNANSQTYSVGASLLV